MTLPKQIILVYLGVLLVQESKDNTVNIIVLGITFLTTIIAGAYIYVKMRKTKTILLEEQATRLNAKQPLTQNFDPEASSDSEESFLQPQITAERRNQMRPPPTSASWQESYEMNDARRPHMKPAEFI
jgi:hypothetical protein